MRVFFGCLWFVILFVGIFFFGLVGVAFYAQQGLEKAQQEKAAEVSTRKYMGPMAVAALIFSGLLAVTGVLPGTRRRKALPVPDPTGPGHELARSWDQPGGGADPSTGSREAPDRSRKSPSTDTASARVTLQIEGGSTHEFTFSGFWDRWCRIVPGAFVLLVVGVLLVGLGLKGGRGGVILPGIGLFVIGGGFTLYLLWRMLAISQVQVGQQGVTWSGMAGTRTQPWDTIKEIWRTEIITNRMWRTRKLCLTFVNGGSVTFDQSMSDYDSLAQNVNQVAGGFILARKRREMAETGEAKFGPAKLRRDGIELSGGWFDWQRLARFQVENGHLVLYSLGSGRRDGGDQSVPLSVIPNYLVLLHMLEERDVMA